MIWNHYGIFILYLSWFDKIDLPHQSTLEISEKKLKMYSGATIRKNELSQSAAASSSFSLWHLLDINLRDTGSYDVKRLYLQSQNLLQQLWRLRIPLVNTSTWNGSFLFIMHIEYHRNQVAQDIKGEKYRVNNRGWNTEGEIQGEIQGECRMWGGLLVFFPFLFSFWED